MKEEVKKLLQKRVGKENSITVKKICEKLRWCCEFGDDRSMVRKIVRSLIDEGMPIGSGNTGFYMITTHGEVVEAIDNLRKRRDSINDRIMSLTRNPFFRAPELAVPKKKMTSYDRLVERVRAIDPKAARYMDTKARKLKSFSPTADTLAAAFVWSSTRQGHDYWSELDDRMLGLYNG